MPNLIYTLIVNDSQIYPWRTLGKIWASSLLAHRWDGDVILFKDFERPIYLVPREGFCEHVLDEVTVLNSSPMRIGKSTGKSLASVYQKARIEIALDIVDPSKYEWIVLSDPDHIVLRNPDHLLSGNSDIIVRTDHRSGCFRTGFVAVRGNQFEPLLSRWLSKLKEGSSPAMEQESLTLAAKELNLQFKEFEAGEIASMDSAMGTFALAEPAIFHINKCDLSRKIWLGTAFHLAAKYATPGGTFLDILEM